MTIRIFLADDHLIFRQGLRSLLEGVEGMEVVGEAGDGRQTVKLADKIKPDVVVLDISMPLLNGIEATRQIIKVVPKARVIILSMHKDRQYITEALKAGALGYITKEESFDQLIVAIKTVLKRKIFLCPDTKNIVLNDFVRQLRSASSLASGSPLTDREREVLQLIAEGKTGKDIAEMLFVSPATIDTHRRNIMRKLSIHTIAGLVKYAIQNKIISLE
ncbi:MAG: response regulator transcription factor [Deltaproteobacteria bacterium]|nr:response regulator transcription factor [Deltaproteobacteria bacterium]MBW2647891.1 response regulator transcription factor [Deltaproteobacteria bacterium]